MSCKSREVQGSPKFRIVSGLQLSLEITAVLSVSPAEKLPTRESAEAREFRLFLEINFFAKLNQKTIAYDEPKLITYVSMICKLIVQFDFY